MLNDVLVFSDKPLLMLQSVKRAFRLDPESPKLHSCLIIYHDYLAQCQGGLEAPVETVLKQEIEPIFRGRDARQMNAEFLEANPKSLEALFESEYFSIQLLQIQTFHSFIAVCFKLN